jgi:hypothetical protein
LKDLPSPDDCSGAASHFSLGRNARAREFEAFLFFSFPVIPAVYMPIVAFRKPGIETEFRPDYLE